ncbi:hypothetical protein BDR07DRAFT_1376194 [Suillus spraguei]|nr:hypothetical protein BDR07DRAFT_1376194 [Suillus spraguei]
MPKVSKWKYCHHFNQLTIHCKFPPEHTCTPPPLTQHRVFSHDADSSVLDLAQNNPFAAQSVVPNLLPSKIPKPQGEVTCISQGGYNLQMMLGWPASDYEETWVVYLEYSSH